MSPRLGAIACLVLLASFATLSWTAVTRMSATTDEPVHAYAAWLITRHGDYRVDREDPPLWKFIAALPQPADALRHTWDDDDWRQSLRGVSTPSRPYMNAIFQTPGVDGPAFIARSRAAMLPVGVSLALLTTLVAWWLGGPTAGVVACALFCLNPSLIGHAPLVKSDVPFTLIYLAAAIAAWLVGRTLTWQRAVALALLAGMAPVVKFSGLILLPALAVAFLGRALIRTPWRVLGRDLTATKPKLLAAAALLVLCLTTTGLVIWATYSFRFLPTPDPGVSFNMTGLLGVTAGQQIRAAGGAATPDALAAWRPDLLTRAILIADEHHLLPQAWLAGFLYTRASSWMRPAFLLGQIRPGGWWYYFPLAFAFKTPLTALATLLTSAVAATTLLIRRRWPTGRIDAWSAAAFGIPPLVYVGFAMSNNLNIGLRHIFPIFPFLFVAAGVLVADATRRSKAARVVATFALLTLAAETLWAFPDYIPYFNAASGGVRGGAALLADSNLDWNQDLLQLADWERRHPDQPLYLAYSGPFDPASYGVRATRVTPADGAVVGRPDQPPPPHATIAVRVGLIQRTLPSAYGPHAFDLVRNTRPREIVGGSFYLYPYPIPAP